METQLERTKESQKNVDSAHADEAVVNTATKSKSSKATKKTTEKALHTYDTIVIGAGISGIAAAHKMQQAGYDNYIVLEKASRVGGTWRDNNYPGCGCDVPSALYSFSFAPSHQWSHLFAKQPEILSYLEGVVAQFNLQDKIQFKHINPRFCSLSSGSALIWCKHQVVYNRLGQGLFRRSLTPENPDGSPMLRPCPDFLNGSDAEVAGTSAHRQVI